jgi:iron(III) transport system substrate-binding protein
MRIADSKVGRPIRNPQSTIRNSGAVLLLVLSVACQGDGRTPLVIYSPHGRDLLTLFEQRFEAARPDVDVRWLDMGTQEVYDRIRSERANPQADVWFGGSSAVFATAARDSLLDPYRPPWAGAVPERAHGPGDLFFAVYETPVVIEFNEQALTAAEAPGDWDELLDPKWTGKILIRDPLASGTMRAVWGMIMERGIKASGDTAAGYAWLRRLDAQTKEYVLNAALLDEKLVRQEGLVTIWDLPDVMISRRRGKPLGYRFPASGTPSIQDPIAVVRGAQQTAIARAFVDFVGTPEMQLVAVREVFRLPARADLPLDSLPEWARDVRTAMRVADVDWQLLADRGPEWMRRWDQHVRGRGRSAAR